MARSQNLIGKVREGMDVFSSDGDKLGTVADIRYGADLHVFRGVLEPEERSYFEVKTGVLGLGKRLSFEAESIRDVGVDRVVLTCTYEEAEGTSRRHPIGS